MSRKPWTKEEDAVLRSRYPTEGAKALRESLPGRTLAAIHLRAGKLGVIVSNPKVHGSAARRIKNQVKPKRRFSRDHAAETIRRLASIDEALAGEGLHLKTAAEEHQTSVKTIRRDIETLNSLGLETVVEPQDGEHGPGTHYLHRYVNRERRLFGRWYPAWFPNPTGK